MSTYNKPPRAHVAMNGEGRIGLVLALTALAAFGGYTAFFLAGFIGDLVG